MIQRSIERMKRLTEWIKRDPIVRFQKYLTDKGLLTDDKAAAVEG